MTIGDANSAKDFTNSPTSNLENNPTNELFSLSTNQNNPSSDITSTHNSIDTIIFKAQDLPLNSSLSNCSTQTATLDILGSENTIVDTSSKETIKIIHTGVELLFGGNRA
jgi:hypothetical protein